MIIIPREKPVVQDLNSYYLNIAKLIEHYQGEVGAGAVYFKSPVSEAVLFFDEQNVINGHFEDRKERIHGQSAIQRIADLSAKNNFSVSVYRILPERLYFWANLPNSKVLYNDLTSDFTDLEGLIKKMEAEKLTGYIDVQLKGEEGGLLFIYNGEVIGGSSADGSGNLDRSTEYRDDLIHRSRKVGGKFNVSKIFLDSTEPTEMPAPSAKPAPKAAAPKVAPRPAAAARQPDKARVMEMLEMLLGTVEAAVRANKKIKMDFETLLNKKFVEKIDKYDFLDPFAAEFKYSGGKITFTGRAGQQKLVNAIVECVSEIATSTGMMNQLRRQLDPWRKRYADEVVDFNVRL